MRKDEDDDADADALAGRATRVAPASARSTASAPTGGGNRRATAPVSPAFGRRDDAKVRGVSYPGSLPASCAANPE